MREQTAIIRVKIAAALLFAVGLSACGGEKNLICDEPRRYHESVDHERLKAPEGLDELDSFREMPLPEANPKPERPKGSPCLELPPRISASG